VSRTPGSSNGLIESLALFAGTLVAIVHTRLNLVSVELEEGLENILSRLAVTLIVLFFLGIGVVLVTMLIVFAFWDSHRLLSLGALAGFYLILGIVVWASALRNTKTKPELFAASLSELSKDRHRLTPRS
jgi:uncharacterized membrane protein YqjE